MIHQQIITKFQKSFYFKNTLNSRGIGIECEIPIVTQQGEAVDLFMIQNMFIYLKTVGFELEWDPYANVIIAATKMNTESASKFEYCTDTITTDTGYSILELVLAPQNNLHTIQSRLWELLRVITTFFDRHNCLVLGYGIQPLTAPSRKLLMPKERYSFFEHFSTHHFIPKSEGADSSFLNITASNQCHIEVSIEDAIPATNMLNALSGLFIIFHANSPIWKGKPDVNYKANREMLWKHCFPDRQNQIGIPPQFDSIANYVTYLLDFKPLLVQRAGQFFKIINKMTFKEFLSNQSPAIGSSLLGKKVIIQPELNDIQDLIPFSWFNARLVPKYGTIESRMCCQQPPKETLTSTALTLGVLENLEAAQDLANTYSLATWRYIHTMGAKHTFDTVVDGVSIVPLLKRLLDIAFEGLRKRNLGEETLLQPLYKRIEQRKAPADTAIAIFKQQGMNAFLNYTAFKTAQLTPYTQNEVSSLIS